VKRKNVKDIGLRKKGKDSRNHLGQHISRKKGNGKAHKKGSLHIRQELIIGKRF
jgi:hypothetical protein